MRLKSKRFDVVGFHQSLDGVRKARKLNWKEVAQETGVGPSTLTRIGQGKAPDAVALTVLARWAGLNPTVFLDDGAPGSENSLVEALARIRSDQTIPTDVRGMLEDVLKSALERMKAKASGG